MSKKLKKDMSKRGRRRKRTAEVFTPHKLVNEILDKLPTEVWEEKEDNTFLDPACGNGNFLVEVLKRKISKGHDPTEALKTIYGLDIIGENVAECRARLLEIIKGYEGVTREHIRTVFQNIRNMCRYTRGSLDYDMSFERSKDKRAIEKWYKDIQEGGLDEIDYSAEAEDTPEKLVDMFNVTEFGEEQYMD